LPSGSDGEAYSTKFPAVKPLACLGFGVSEQRTGAYERSFGALSAPRPAACAALTLAAQIQAATADGRPRAIVLKIASGYDGCAGLEPDAGATVRIRYN